jgi:hypothetical protein
MLFRYKISLEVEVDFEAPLLGTDTTKGRRKQADLIAKGTLAEMVKLGTTSYLKIDREIKEENLNGTIKGELVLRSHKMLEKDKND